MQDITVTSADLSLPFQTDARHRFLADGEETSTPRLEQHMGQTTVVPADALASETEFTLPDGPPGDPQGEVERPEEAGPTAADDGRG